MYILRAAPRETGYLREISNHTLMTKLYGLVIITLTFSLLNPSQVSAQAFTDQSTIITAGYGAGTFSNAISNLFDPFNEVNHSLFGPVYLKVERGVSDHIGLGLNFAYVENKWEYEFGNGYDSLGNLIKFTETDTRTSYSVLARMNFHFGNSKKVDPYVGFGLGYRKATWKSSTNNPSGNSGIDLQTYTPYGFETTIGLRYLFTPNFQVYTEWGLAKSVFELGAAFYLPGIPRAASGALIRP